MRKIVLATIAFISSTALHATAPLTYSFNLQNNNTALATSTNSGNTISFSQSIAGGGSISLVASAWNATKTNGTYLVKKATLGQYVGGLGVTSANDDLAGSQCGPGQCGTHQIDNLGNGASSSSIDFVRLTFSQAVTLGSISRYAFGTDNAALNGTVYDDDFSYGKGGTIFDGAILTDSAFASLFGTNVGGNGACTVQQSVACFDTSTLSLASAATSASSSTTWFVAASLLGNYGGDGVVDAFKIASLNAYLPVATPASPAPEPASWAMMVFGFGAAGTALRRRKAAGLAAA